MKSKRETIKEVAASLFRKKGYQATSMRLIAQEVGMEAASLYNHIKSKQELLKELLLNVAYLFTKGMDDIIESSLNPIDKMEKLIGLHVQLTVNHTDAISLITSEWVHLEKPAQGEYLQLRDAYEKKFKKIIKNCIKEGYFAEVDADIALFSILSTLRWLYSWYSRHGKINPVELEKQMIHCLIDGLRK